MTRIHRIALIILSVFLAVTAIPGGIALIVGFQAPPASLLDGSPFPDYLIPGLVLAVVVGGSAVISTVMLLARHRHARRSTLASGLLVMSFEVVEMLVIGSPPGPARVMQLLFLAVGLCLAVGAGLFHHQDTGRIGTR